MSSRPFQHKLYSETLFKKKKRAEESQAWWLMTIFLVHVRLRLEGELDNSDQPESKFQKVSKQRKIFFKRTDCNIHTHIHHTKPYTYIHTHTTHSFSKLSKALSTEISSVRSEFIHLLNGLSPSFDRLF